MNFESFEFNKTIAKNIEKLGYEEPTPIQAQALPAVLKGRDVMGLAQTGTGKTAVFVLPILKRLMNGARGRVRALIVAPTRELAEQINDHFRSLGRGTGLSSMSVYGGMNINPQIKKLDRGAEIVVACPGRLLDHMNRGTVDLKWVEVLVLDEADRMLDMGFLPDIKRIIKCVPPGKQTLLFSATMPRDIRKLVEDFMHEPVKVQINHSKPVDTVSHALYPVEQHQKTELLMKLLKSTETDSVLVFTRTKHKAKSLGHQLERAGYGATSLQGNLSQKQRQTAITGFRNGKYRILVATDIAARGIDVSSISHVINYDIPDTADAYTHRIGRTGRALKTGDAYTLVTRDDEEVIKTIEKRVGARIERRTVEDFEYRRSSPKKKVVKPSPHQSGRTRGDPGRKKNGTEVSPFRPHSEKGKKAPGKRMKGKGSRQFQGRRGQKSRSRGVRCTRRNR